MLVKWPKKKQVGKMKTDAETQNGGQIFVVAGGRIWQHVNNIIANCFFSPLFFRCWLCHLPVSRASYFLLFGWSVCGIVDGATSVAFVATCLLFLFLLAHRHNRQHYWWPTKTGNFWSGYMETNFGCGKIKLVTYNWFILIMNIFFKLLVNYQRNLWEIK